MEERGIEPPSSIRFSTSGIHSAGGSRQLDLYGPTLESKTELPRSFPWLIGDLSVTLSWLSGVPLGGASWYWPGLLATASYEAPGFSDEPSVHQVDPVVKRSFRVLCRRFL